MSEEEPPGGWTVDVFRPYVEDALDEWKRGDMFMKIGLAETDTILKEGEAAPAKGDKGHPFNKIFSFIIKEIAAKFNLVKQKKKTVSILLRSLDKEWEALVKAKQIQSPIKKKGSATTGKESSAMDAKDQPEAAEVKTESKEIEVKEEMIESPVQHMDGVPIDLTPRQLQMKEKFEKRKQEVLDSLPGEVKSKFGQQFFAKWAKSPLPVLVLSPYNVPPGPVRDMWFDMYEKVKKQGRLASASNLVYWYGAYDDPANAYSFVIKSKLIPFAIGEKKGLGKVPNAIRKKLDEGKKIGGADKMLLQGIEEMEEDKAKEPDDRHGRMNQVFLEDWEFVEEEVIVQEEEKSKPKAKPKNKKTKKRKNKDDQVDPVPKKQKKTKKAAEEPKQDEEKKPKVKEGDGPATPVKLEDIGDIGDNDVSSHDDKDDLEDAEPPSESDEDDEDFEYGKGPVKKPKTQKKVLAAAKAPPKKKSRKTKTKVERGRKDGEKKVPEGERRRRQELTRFTACEDKYLKVIDDWKYGLENQSKGTIKEIYVRLLDCVTKFSAPFIEAYEMPVLMKQSKKIVDDENRLKLWKTMKEVYQAKKKEVPAGFVPQKRVRNVEVAPEKEVIEKPKRISSVEEIAERDKSTKVPTKTKFERQDVSSSAPTKPGTPVATTEKKKFSLGSIMTKPKSTNKPGATSGLIRSLSSSSQLSKRQENPQWISETSIKDILDDENRSFALEFLQQATPFIPPNDKVNSDVIARELETSIFEWAGGKDGVAVTDCFVKYWDKVDDMVAAISGDGGNGTIARMISQGRFQSASEVVRLSENDIVCSYEGRPLEDFKFE
ncbi:unnamed protein product [Cylindrotheca closterium]|uniref:Uncharacterized protein n=1 Tax=Cylindrotheca closterium TaxID=2856 RepID=A0AAD2JM25_9STRA|nr:unnamed protein product [Cylindrotheca closterium]